MNKDSLILDANVLISAYQSNWFKNLTFWNDKYNLLTPKAVWEHEFTPYHDVDNIPDWLSVIEVTESITIPNPGQLSQQDWRGIVLARGKDGVLITNDKSMKKQAEKLGVSTQWSAGFLIQTFEKCGISTSEYHSGLETYIADSFLNDRVTDELQSAEKL